MSPLPAFIVALGLSVAVAMIFLPLLWPTDDDDRKDEQ